MRRWPIKLRIWKTWSVWSLGLWSLVLSLPCLCLVLVLSLSYPCLVLFCRVLRCVDIVLIFAFPPFFYPPPPLPTKAAIERDQMAFSLALQTNPVWGLDRVDQRSTTLDGLYYYKDSAGAGVDMYSTSS
jgi:hypothetical protein